MSSSLPTTNFAIKYIVTYNKKEDLKIQVGDTHTYNDNLFEKICSSDNFDIHVNFKKYYGSPNSKEYMYTVVNDELVYCIIFHGSGFKTIENCMKTLLEFQDDLKKPYDAKTINFLTNEYTRIINFYNDPSNDQINIVKDKIEDIKQTMQDSIHVAVCRGEELNLLNNKAEALEYKVHAFDKTANDLKKKMCMENVKITIYIIGTVFCIVMIIAFLFFGIMIL